MFANDQREEKIQHLIQQIKSQYKQLRKCDSAPIQQIIISSMIPRCHQALTLLYQESQRSQNVIKIKQIKDIQKKIQQLRSQNQDNHRLSTEIGKSGRLINRSTQEGYSSKYNTKLKQARQTIIQTIVFKQLTSVNLKINDQQLQKVLHQMQNNQQVIKLTQNYIKQQGSNIDNIDEEVQKIYDTLKQTNKELDLANEEQIKLVTGIQKAVHKTACGIWGVIKWPFKLLFWWKK